MHLVKQMVGRVIVVAQGGYGLAHRWLSPPSVVLTTREHLPAGRSEVDTDTSLQQALDNRQVGPPIEEFGDARRIFLTPYPRSAK